VRARLAPEVVLRVGATPTSASLQSWLLEQNGGPHIVVDDGGRWKDSGATATHYLQADPADALWRLGERMRALASAEDSTRGDDERGWGALWRRADAAARTATAEPVQGHEGHGLARVLGALGPGAGVFVSSSMPIRDLDAYGHPLDGPIDVFASRGASGIDGIVSTAFGIASRREGPVVCVVGDVAFFHDRNGLLWSREPDAPVVFVLIDNDGGGIFHMLPIVEHEPHFTRLFATPHGIDPRPVVESHGLDFADASDEDLADAVRTALASGRSAVVRIRTDRERNRRLHAETREAVGRSVREALG